MSMAQLNFQSLQDFKAMSGQAMNLILMFGKVILTKNARRERRWDMDKRLTLRKITSWHQELVVIRFLLYGTSTRGSDN